MGVRGLSKIVQKFSNVGSLGQATESGALFFGDSTPETAMGGQYRLCWCGATAYPSGIMNVTELQSSTNNTNTTAMTCSLPEHFRTDFGALEVLGPGPTFPQSRTCVSGQPCELQHFVGLGLSERDNLFVLDTCGLEGVPSRFQAAALTEFVKRTRDRRCRGFQLA